MRAVIGNEFTLVGVHPLDDVMEFLQKGGVVHLRAGTRQRFARKPTTFVVRIKNFEVASFDFDDQPQLLRELELVTIVARSAVDKIADVDRSGLQPY